MASGRGGTPAHLVVTLREELSQGTFLCEPRAGQKNQRPLWKRTPSMRQRGGWLLCLTERDVGIGEGVQQGKGSARVGDCESVRIPDQSDPEFRRTTVEGG